MATLANAFVPTGLRLHRFKSIKVTSEAQITPVILLTSVRLTAKYLTRMSNLYTIERVVAGDGTNDKSGIVLEKGKTYGSSSLTGGNESFHEISMKSLNLFKFARKIKLRSRPPTEPHLIKKRRSRLKEIKNVQLQALQKRLNENAGVVMKVSEPGARGKIDGIRAHQVRDEGPTMATGNDGSCLLAALLNAIWLLKGENSVNDAYSKVDEEQQLESVGRSNGVLHKMGQKLEMRKVKTGSEDKFQWLAKKEKGTYIVRLFKPKVVDHVVVVSCEKKSL